MADLHFTFSRGGEPYATLDWAGFRNITRAAGAAEAAIEAVMEIAVEDARANHPDYPPDLDEQSDHVPGPRFWNRTEQTIEHVRILEHAEIIGWTDAAFPGQFGIFARVPEVKGEWGVSSGPAFQDPDIWSGRWPGYRPRFKRPVVGEMQNVSIENRAMFLEFGTVKMAPRPFIYPAFDRSKALLLPLLAEFYRISPSHAPFRG